MPLSAAVRGFWLVIMTHIQCICFCTLLKEERAFETNRDCQFERTKLLLTMPLSIFFHIDDNQC